VKEGKFLTVAASSPFELQTPHTSPSCRAVHANNCWSSLESIKPLSK